MLGLGLSLSRTFKSRGGSTPPVEEVDLMLTLESGTAGSLISLAGLTASTLGEQDGAWDYIPPATEFDHAYIGDFNYERRQAVTVGGVVTDGPGSRGLRIDHEVQEANGYDGFRWVVPGALSVQGVTLGYMIQPDANCDEFSDNRIDHSVIYHGSTFAVLQQHLAGNLDDGEFLAHGTDGVVSTFGGPIPIERDHLYSVYLRANATDQLAEVLVLDGVTGEFIGYSWAECAISFDLSQIIFAQDYLSVDGGETRYDNFVLNWSSAPIALEAFTIPAPSPIIAVESGTGEVTVSWPEAVRQHDLQRMKNGGAWVTLETDFEAYEYIDSDVVETDVVKYRVRRKIDTILSSYSESNEVTVGEGGGPGAGYEAAVLALSPVLYWKLADDGTGLLAEDATANNRNGGYSVTGVTYEETSLIDDGGACVLLDGAAGVVNIASEAALNITGDFTLCAIAKPSSLTGSFGMVAAKASGGAPGSRQYEIGCTNADKWRGNLSDGSGFVAINGVTTINVSRADHILLTVNSGVAKLYINGAEEGSESVAATNSDTGDFAVGQLGSLTANFFAGHVAHVFILNAGLDASEVSDLFDETGL